MAQYGRPDGTIDPGNFNGWNGSAQTADADMWQTIDEVSASDTDYIRTDDDTAPTLCILSMSSITDPGVSTGHIFRFRYAKTNDGVPGAGAAGGDTITLVARIYLANGVTILVGTGALTATENWQDGSITVDEADVNTYLTDQAAYDGLRFRFEVNQSGGGGPSNRRGVAISWAEFEVPDSGPPALSGSGSMSQGSSTTASGTGAHSSAGSVSQGSSMAASGNAETTARSGTGSMSTASAVTGSGTKQVSGVGAASQASSMAASGSNTPVLSGSGSMSAATAVAGSGSKQGSGAASLAQAQTLVADGVNADAPVNVGLLTINGVDRTDFADMNTFWVEDQANRLISTAGFEYRDETRSHVLRERQEVIVTVDGDRIFGGQIAQLTPTYDGGATVFKVRCQGFDCLFDQYVIESGVRTGVRTDADDVAWIVAHIPGADGATFVEQVRESAMPDMDYSGMTVRKALDTLQSTIGGALFWMDHLKQVHWTDPRSKQLVRNGDFEDGASLWSLASSTTNIDGGPGGTGDESWETSTTGGSATQNISGITGLRRYLVFADLYHTVDGATRLRLQWRDAGLSIIQTDTLTHDAGASTWGRKKAIVQAPAAATSVVVTLDTTAAGTGRGDNVNLIGQTAGWSLSDTPDGIVSFAPMNWKEPSDATTPVNRVLIRGAGISGWREHAASISYYGQVFEGVLDDERVTTTDGLDSRAAWVFSKYAFPTKSGTYWTIHEGLEAGQFQIVEMAGATSIQWIATLKTHFRGDNGLLFEVTYGSPVEDMGATLASMQSVLSDSEAILNQPPPPGTDTTAPATPSNVAISTGNLVAPDGTMRPYLLATWDANADADLNAYELQIDRDLGLGITFTNPTTIRTGAVSHYTEDVIGNVEYGIRVRAIDHAGNASAWTATISTLVGADDEPPAIPSGLSAVGGYRLIGLRWDPVDVIDLLTYEVRWTTDDGTGTAPSTTWVTVRTSTTWIVVQQLEPDVLYYFQVRAIDRSGNVDDGTGVAVVAAENPDSGWSNGAGQYVTAVPSLVSGSADIAAASITAQHIAAEGLVAEVLKGGTLSIGGLPDAPDFLIVYDVLGQEIGRWDQDGLVITDPSEPLKKVRISNGIIDFSVDGGATWTTAISGEGIVADAITLGTAPGGHNAIPNASLELAAFVTLIEQVWTDATDWQAHLAGDVNIDDSTGSLSMLTVTY